MIQTKSMLINLTIHQWTATKHDKSVSAEVEKTHQAKDAGRYNKRLIDKAHLADVATAANAVRKVHDEYTLPWLDRGHRLLPSRLFMEYRTDLAKAKAAFDKNVNEFVTLYPKLVQDARVRLNTMFQPGDYPDVGEIKKLFGIDTDFIPVPNVADFRVDLAKESQDEIRGEISKAIIARQAKALEDCWSRVREVTTRVADQCAKQDGVVIRDSLMGNVEKLAGILDGLNIGDDPAITQVAIDLRGMVVPTLQLRTSKAVRERIGLAASDILKRIP